MKKMLLKQPELVCNDCGPLHGNWWKDGEYVGPRPHEATFSIQQCDVCGQQKQCTEARDFGYLRETWKANAEKSA
jgi:hypothetical protein